MPNNRSVVVLSGGQDSATTALIAREESRVVGAIHFQYGQRHDVEMDCAKWWAKNVLTVDLYIVPVPSLGFVSADSALVAAGAKQDIGGVSRTNPDLPASFVPGRNLIFLTLAAAFAHRLGADLIYTGVCQTDYSGYPDCRNETIKSLETTLHLGIGRQLAIQTPLMFLTKAETFEVADKLGYLTGILEHTHTCYEGNHETRHVWGYGCAECPACKIRAKGYQEFIQHLQQP